MPKKNSRRTSFQRPSIQIPNSKLGMLIALLAGFASGYGYVESQNPVLFSSNEPHPVTRVCFSPEGNCEKLVLKAIASAQKQILVQAYAMTSKPITEALIRSHQQGVQVKVLYDASQSRTPYSRIRTLEDVGIVTAVDQTDGLAHNKVVIIDDKALLVGSYNWTHAAHAKNAENLLLIQDPQLIKIYQDNWWKRFRRGKENG